MTETSDIKADFPRDIWLAALRWQVEAGVDESLCEEPLDKTALKPVPLVHNPLAPASAVQPQAPPASSVPQILGTSDAREEAIRIARAANTLEELRNAVAGFDGIALKRTATNLVFGSGNPKAALMLVGEAPGADEDRLGEPFVGVSGQLLDRMLACIELSRQEEDPQKSVYISNILNWRPPGNRAPTPGEIEVSLPFIERHILLSRPKLLVLVGGVSAKALLGRSEGISKLRQRWHTWRPQCDGIGLPDEPIPAIATFHPSYLLRTPAQKRAAWADLLMLQGRLVRSDKPSAP
ncbi:MAG: uracil-DNA glycosylase [Alphaproteobacteria bacterium]|nr:uracil-DNA glycosylase [Alphaproteobacteria bacterium]